MMNATRFEQVETRLNALQMFGIKLGLDNIHALVNGLNGAVTRLKFIHLAGSNGKGSTGAMLQAMLREVGFRVGFFTSPHLISPLERIRIDGCAISEEAWCDAFDQVQAAAVRLTEEGGTPTYFEFHTAMAIAAFDAAKVDFVVWETGMGGRLDATNVIPAPVAVAITGIALEHQKYLGSTLAQIAGEKAGIVKESCPVFIGCMPEEAAAVIAAKAAEKRVPCHRIGAEDLPQLQELLPDGQVLLWRGMKFVLALRGTMQRRNAALALAVIDYLSQKYDFECAQAIRGLAQVTWPARLQELPDGTWLDGGHNPDGIGALLEALQERFPGKKFNFIFGAFADKDVSCELELLNKLAAQIVFVPIKGGLRPCAEPTELVKRWRQISSVPSLAAADAGEALKLCPAEDRVICGSLFLAGEILELLLGKEAALNI